MNKKTIITSSVATALLLASTLTALAEVNVTTVMASTTKNHVRSQQKIETLQERGDKQTEMRIDALNKLLTRIQAMKNLSDSEKTTIIASIQANITSMTNLDAKIKADTSTTTLRADLQTVAPDYRIYMLIMPQVSILSAVDRINTLVASLQTVQGKIQARLSTSTTLSTNATITADLSDVAAKLADASTQGNAAQAEVSALVPDQGNKTVAQSNTAALKDARTKIQTAQKDLQTARKDIQAIVKIIVQEDKN
jgi:hypothetical protein